MISFKQHIAEKYELGPGSRVIINQSRFRSGRDPGRKLERLTGTIRRMKEDGHCFVEFDRHVAIQGKKVKSMRMKSSYLERLDESNNMTERGPSRTVGALSLGSGNAPKLKKDLRVYVGKGNGKSRDTQLISKGTSIQLTTLLPDDDNKIVSVKLFPVPETGFGHRIELGKLKNAVKTKKELKEIFLDEDILDEIGYRYPPGDDKREPMGQTLTASAKDFSTSTDKKGKEIKGMPRKHFEPKGEGQVALGGWVANKKKGETFELSTVHRLIKPRISQFAKLQSAANMMAKKGLVDFDGISKITIR